MDGASVRRVRDLVGARSGPEAAMLTAFGLMCASAVDFKLIIRDAVILLRRILEADTIGFFWSDPKGSMIDAYVEKPALLSTETFLAHQLYIEQAAGNWPTFTENVLAGPVAGYLLSYQNANFYSSEMFAVSYQKIGVRYVLDAVVHDGERPLGSYLFMRTPEQGAFDNDDVELALTIAHLTTLAFQSRVRALIDSTRLSDAGLIMVDADGSILFHDNEAFQSLWLLERGGNVPVVGGPEVGFDTLAAQFCPELAAAAQSQQRVTRHNKCRWGDFEIHSQAQRGVTAIRFMQRRPFVFHIAMKLIEWRLPARRLTVCWLALMGFSRKEIAAIAGIGADTVGEHLDAVFKRLGLNSTVELLLRVAA